MLLWSLDWTRVPGGSTSSTSSTSSTGSAASTMFIDGGTHLEGPLIIAGIGFQYPNSTNVYLRGDGNWRTLRFSPVNSTIVLSTHVLIIRHGVIVSMT